LNNKFKNIENIVKDEKNHDLIEIRNKIVQTDNKLITKELFFGCKALLNNFFNNNFIETNIKNIDFNKIEMFVHDGLFEDLFNELYSKKIEIKEFDIVNLSEKSNYIYTDYERTNDFDNVYGTLKNDVLYAMKKKEELFQTMDKNINARYKSSMNIFNFGPYVFNSVSIGYNNLPFITGVSWFADELKDYKINLHYSFEYYIDIKFLEKLYEVFKVLSEISEDVAQVTLSTTRKGVITVKFKRVDDKQQNFVYEIQANNIEELYELLKGTNQNTFINFLSHNNLLFKYQDNILSCYKLSNKKVFSIDNISIKNFSVLELNYIMSNINYNLNLLDLTYYSLHLLLPSPEDIIKEFTKSPIENKLKLFISIFSIKKNIDYSKYELDDYEIAKFYGTTRNNIVETYKKKKVVQYEILRLGTTCKAYGIGEEDLLELIKSYKLEKI
jgi:hypothetical protein